MAFSSSSKSDTNSDSTAESNGTLTSAQPIEAATSTSTSVGEAISSVFPPTTIASSNSNPNSEDDSGSGSESAPSDSPIASTFNIKYISSQTAASLDEHLMSPAPHGCGYELQQLMELAGLACAQAVFNVYPPSHFPRALIACGPGNQGGDGLVAARHLRLWGYDVAVWYPKPSKKEFLKSLVSQLEAFAIPIIPEDDFEDAIGSADVMLDAIFGEFRRRSTKDFAIDANSSDEKQLLITLLNYSASIHLHARPISLFALLALSIFADSGFSFKGPVREPFVNALDLLAAESRFEFESRQTRPPIISVDIPSSWDVDAGNTSSAFTPEVLISLSAPKTGVKSFKGKHFIGGRFIPPSVNSKFNLGIPRYLGDSQIVDITGCKEAKDHGSHAEAGSSTSEEIKREEKTSTLMSKLNLKGESGMTSKEKEIVASLTDVTTPTALPAAD